MEDFFRRKGNTRQLDGSHPLLLTGGDSVYLVVGGSVDIFSVSLKNGAPSDRRDPIMRVDQGQLMFGQEMSPHAIGLIAVGTLDTEVLEMKLEKWLDGIEEASQASRAAQLLSIWVQGLGEGVRSQLVPKSSIQLPEGEPRQLEADDHVVAEDEILWVEHSGTRLQYMDYEDLPADGIPYFLPLSQSVWATCISPGGVRGIDTTRFLQLPTAGAVLEKFHQMILVCIRQKRADDALEERERLNRKTAQDSHKMAYSLIQLESVLSESDAEAMIGKSDDLLLSSCQIIGEHAGISFQATPEAAQATGIDKQLASICRTSRVRHRQVSLRDSWWKLDGGPMLAFKKSDGQPVALIPFQGRGYKLHDTLQGSIQKVVESTAASLSPVAYMFYRPLPEKILSGTGFLRFGLQHCAPDIRNVVLMGLAAALLGLLVPIATGFIFDNIIPSASRNQLLQITIILLSCAVATTLFELTRVVAVIRVETRADIALQSAVWDRLLSLPAPFFRNFTAGDLANRGLGINAIRQVVSGTTVSAVIGGIFSLINFALLLYYSWKLALIAAALSIAGLVIIVAASYRKIRHQREVNALEGRIFGSVLQLITGIAKLRVSGVEASAFSVWASQFTTQKQEAYRAGTVDCWIATFNSGFPVFATLCIFAWVAFKSAASFSTGDFMAFNSAFGNMLNAIIQMGVSVTTSLSIVPYYERLKPILREHPESDDAKGHPGELSGAIEINHVSFTYAKDGPQIINDLSLHIDPGEFVAIVGKSGSGKSTLVRLLLGFEAPESGTIYYNRQDLASLDVREVRRQIGVVLQNGQLMTGDIYRNIVGATNLSVDEAWAAARAAGLAEDIESMPMGMNTVIGAGGATFSGGQRQRLLIARAIVGKPRILFFDEATSALDNRTQELVSESLEKFNSTRVVIAHRLSTIMHADRIHVMDRGRIVESGTYEELMQYDGIFAAMAKRQII